MLTIRRDSFPISIWKIQRGRGVSHGTIKFRAVGALSCLCLYEHCSNKTASWWHRSLTVSQRTHVYHPREGIKDLCHHKNGHCFLSILWLSHHNPVAFKRTHPSQWLRYRRNQKPHQALVQHLWTVPHKCEQNNTLRNDLEHGQPRGHRRC